MGLMKGVTCLWISGFEPSLFTLFSSDGHCPLVLDCHERALSAFSPITFVRPTLVHPTRSLATHSRPMSSEESVIAVSNEISEPERVDSSAIPSSEPLAAKDVSVIADPSSAEPVSDLPADAAQSPSNDTLPTLLKHDKNIPSTTPTNLNGSANEVGTTTFVSVKLLNLLPYA